MKTCHSDDPWEMEDALLERRMRLMKRLKYLALFSVAVALLYLIVFGIARASSPKKIPHWQHALETARREGG